MDLYHKELGNNIVYKEIYIYIYIRYYVCLITVRRTILKDITPTPYFAKSLPNVLSHFGN